MSTYLDFEEPIKALEEQIAKAQEIGQDAELDMTDKIKALEEKLEERTKEIFSNLTPWQRVQLSRHPERPYTLAYIDGITHGDFQELHGDRNVSDDKAMVGGFGSVDGKTVMFIGQQKGKNTKMRQYRNFGMANPEGYRKALRLMKLAEKFDIPIVTLIDTPGAFPGLEAEERGQGEAIARNIYEMMNIKVPIICVIIGEGASGGALGIGVGDKVIMLENTWYSVISPESCSSILWRAWDYKEKAAEALKLTSEDMKRLKLVAGGVESMSNVEHYSTDIRKGVRSGNLTLHDRLTRGRVMSQPAERFGVITGMIETAENLAKDYDISREASDTYAVRSHQRAAAAWDKGLFADELVPVSVPQRKGDPILFTQDEGYRADATIESLGKLRPLEGGVVTAGNASQQNDAAAACLIVAEDKLDELGLEPIAWFHSWAAAGCDPSRMGIGPVPAVERLFARNGLGWNDIDLVELNEAFAPQVLAVLKGWGWSDDDSRNEILNVNGSGISLGHPVGATGGRILANLTRELVRRDGRYGLETMCIGGGQGIAAIFERAI